MGILTMNKAKSCEASSKTDCIYFETTCLLSVWIKPDNKSKSVTSSDMQQIEIFKRQFCMYVSTREKWKWKCTIKTLVVFDVMILLHIELSSISINSI